MATCGADRGRPWVEAQLTVRLRGPGPEPGRIIRLRRPFALIGQVPGADLRFDDPAVDGRHALLLVDRRGIFGVDLRSRTGTRFAGAEVDSAWLGPGDILEVAGRRVELLQLRVDGAPFDAPLSDDDPLGDSPGLVGLTLEPLDSGGPPWMLGSALAFAGRGDACAIRVENASASLTHCALFRTESAAHVIDLLGRRTLVNGAAVAGASRLLDGDVLTIGRARFAVKLEPAATRGAPTALARLADAPPGRAIVARDDPKGAMVAWLLEALGPGPESRNGEILDVLRRFQADTATLFEAQLDRIEALNREIGALRREVLGDPGPPPEPVEPLRLDLIPPPIAPAGEPAGWLLDRLDALEAEGRSTWRDLLGRIVSTVAPREAAQPARSLAPVRRGTPETGPR